MASSERTYPIVEIFGPTIQGEGGLIGAATHFIRFGGCDYRCAWCDTMYAVDPGYKDTWRPTTAAGILAQIDALEANSSPTNRPADRSRVPWVTLSGGNPALFDCLPIVSHLHARGYRVVCETQGSMWKGWMDDLDMLVLSPKPPSSHMTVDLAKLDKCALADARDVALKFVVATEEDFAFAREIAERYPRLPVVLQPMNGATRVHDASPMTAVDLVALVDRLAWLVELQRQSGWFAPRILPQMHVLMWGNSKGR